MKKKIIGIVPTSNYMLTNDSFADHYRYCNNYIKKILENDAIPYLIPICDDEVIDDCLKGIDGVIFPGGNRIMEYSLKIMDYCYKNRIPVLGICLGMQTMALYSLSNENRENFLKAVEGHWPKDIFRENEQELAHESIVMDNTVLMYILKSKNVLVNSVHHYAIDKLGDEFIINMKSLDGVIEGIEYKNDDRFMLCVQFHPEILPQYNNIFKYFIEYCEKRK
jgi:putative glutamine amidotransferase